MITYWQKDPRWKNMKIGDDSHTLGSHGCYICAIAYMKGRTPRFVLETLNRNRCFTRSGLLDNHQAAKVLGMNYNYLTANPNRKCVAETDHYQDYGLQHFFVWLSDGKGGIMDPIDGKIKKCGYKIVSYRIWEPVPMEFRKINNNYTPELMKKKKEYCLSIGLICETCDNDWCKNGLKKGG